MATYTTLRRGSTGDEVKNLQKKLGITEDGIYGPQTEAAVREYQKNNGLLVDGIAGNQTLGKLFGGSTTTNTSTETNKNNSFEYEDFEYKDYTESDIVKDAENLLNNHMNNKPGEYTSQWGTQLTDVINKILNREDFSYDLNGDALYQQYKDQFTTQGKQAMMDTMGQAAAMTGGFGNSYAQTVGQQTYQGYLQQLNDKVPELYKLALDRYNLEGQKLKDNYTLLSGEDEKDYGRYRDTVNDWHTDRDYLTNRYDTERDIDYTKYINDRDFDYKKYADDKDFDYAKYIDERNYKYQLERDDITDDLNEREMRVKEGKAGSGSVGNNPIAPVGGGGIVDDDNGSGGFTGSTYEDAVAYMMEKGVPKGGASGMMTQAEWSRRKASYKATGIGGKEVKNYSSYKEYITDFVEYQIEQNRK